MSFLADALTLVVAALHGCFLVVEMFLWTTPRTRKAFGSSEQFAEASRVLAANQGLYNGFLAAGLVWGVVGNQKDVTVFFLVCVVVAGVYGAATANRRILLVQALPAVLALAAVLLSG